MSFGSMRLYWRHLGIAIGSAIALYPNSSIAQITPDRTLPNNSNVRLEGNTRIISSGTTRGANLFHSFSEFSVPNGETAFFNNAPDIQNIISRVTGKSFSDIDGLIRANGKANLFLINPNGMIFGSNASLKIGGSFLASTASSLKFADGTFFSATSPPTTPLLTVSVPIGLQYGSNVGSVQIQGSSLQVNPGKTLALLGGNVSMLSGLLLAPGGRVELGGVAGEDGVGLVANGESFGLSFPQGVPRADVSLTNQAEVNVLASSGGSIVVNAANLNILAGSQLLTGISGVGSPKTQAGDIKINATGIVAIADSSKISNQVVQNAVGNSGNININADSLSLSNNSFLAASTNGQGNAGNVTINTRSLSVLEGSFLAASANGRGNAGKITINARDTVSFGKGSQAYTDVTLKGNGGDIKITTGSLFITDDSFLASSTKGEGNSGNITINARDTISFDRGSAYTDVGENGKGQAGNFNMTSESLSLTNRAQLVASTKNEGNAGNITINTGLVSVADNSFLAASANGRGNAGKITINARDTVSFGKGSQAYTDVTLKGNGGDIKITTGSLFITDDSFLASSTKGEGNSGNITINARDTISFDKGSAYTEVGENGKGQAGNFNMTSESLFLTNRAQLVASTKNEGNAGNITINTGLVSVADNSFLAASANGQQGKAGNITINARDRVLFDRAGQVYTNVTGRGNGGDVSITTGSLTVRNDSILNASTSGVGNAGDITINTDSLFVTNESFLASSANGRGNAGNITINARNTVSFENGAKVYTDVNQLPFSDATQVKGDGGNIKITSESLSLTNGSQLISNTQGEGNAGNIIINTGSLSVTNESFLAASANGQKGNAANITINARDRVLFDKGSAFSNVGVCSLIAVGCTPSNNTIKGNGGNITIKAPSLQLMNGSFLATGVGDDDLLGKKVEGNAGNISIHLRDDLSLDQSFITTRLFANGKGKAGDIKIRAGFVSSDQSLISASTQGQGNAGGVSVQTRGAISLADSDISTAVQQGATGDAQGINIRARSLLLTDGAQLNAVTSGEGKAGNIFINATDRVSVSGTNTTVETTSLFRNNIPPRFNSPPSFVDGVSSGIFTTTNSSAVGGNVTVNTNTLSISNGAVVDARTTASGRGGAIAVNTNTFEAMSGGQLTAITSGSGPAGSITLNATGTATINDSDPTYLARLAQFGDKIDIYGKPKVGNQGAASGLTVSSAGSGSAGDLTVQANSIRLDNGAKISADTKGGGGNIFLNSPLLVLRRGSSITTNASGSNVTGGNIRIDAKNGFIVAVPKENSDITANSVASRGGQITINAKRVFGIQPQNQLTPKSDITAFGKTPDLSGTVEITTPDLDPTSGLVELPINLVDALQQISTACTPGSREFQNTFVSTGRGGLPMSPTEPLLDSSTISAWVRLRAKPENSATTNIQLQPTTVSTTPKVATAKNQIVEATGWIVDRNGNIELVAQTPGVNSHSRWQTPTSCPVSQ